MTTINQLMQSKMLSSARPSCRPLSIGEWARKRAPTCPHGQCAIVIPVEGAVHPAGVVRDNFTSSQYYVPVLGTATIYYYSPTTTPPPPVQLPPSSICPNNNSNS